jgi:hypothetical protein
MSNEPRILVWFSCGAASAVAAKLTIELYGKTSAVEVLYCDTSADEHPDNQRFLVDVEQWIGQQVIRLCNPKYTTVEATWRGEAYIVGRYGASCTRLLKTRLREKYMHPDDEHVIGFTADETKRIENFEERAPNLKCLWVLRDGGITKEACYHVLTANGIELPAMYRLGYGHNNCIGCCKGGKGYWNKIRRDFPERFAARAKVQRELGVAFRSGGDLYFLDELDPDAGRDVPEPQIECGVFCDGYADVVQLASFGLEPGSGE